MFLDSLMHLTKLRRVLDFLQSILTGTITCYYTLLQGKTQAESVPCALGCCSNVLSPASNLNEMKNSKVLDRESGTPFWQFQQSEQIN